MKNKHLYTCRHLYIQNKEIVISKHALIRANNRNIHPDDIEATIKGGTIIRQGKKIFKFIKQYKNRKITCIGEQIDGMIIIKTICKN